MILNYEDHKNLKDIEKLIKKGSNERKILDKLKSFRYKLIDSKVLNKILNYFSDSDINDIEKIGDKYVFNPDLFQYDMKAPKLSFMDFFSRKLTKEVDSKIRQSLNSCEMIIPNECYIESIGKFDKEGRPDNQILRLKKESGKYATQDLKKLDIDVEGYNYINMKLLVSFYHRIHCPINGKLTQMIPIEGKDDFFGKNTLWILKFETEKSPVYLMLVGESTIQDFDFLKEKGDNVNIFDILGYFNWGSQTVILYKPNEYGILNIEEKKKYFVGDCIFEK
jgi:phosphatidylserine decarboxylase